MLFQKNKPDLYWQKHCVGHIFGMKIFTAGSGGFRGLQGCVSFGTEPPSSHLCLNLTPLTRRKPWERALGLEVGQGFLNALSKTSNLSKLQGSQELSHGLTLTKLSNDFEGRKAEGRGCIWGSDKSKHIWPDTAPLHFPAHVNFHGNWIHVFLIHLHLTLRDAL